MLYRCASCNMPPLFSFRAWLRQTPGVRHTGHSPPRGDKVIHLQGLQQIYPHKIPQLRMSFPRPGVLLDIPNSPPGNHREAYIQTCYRSQMRTLSVWGAPRRILSSTLFPSNPFPHLRICINTIPTGCTIGLDSSDNRCPVAPLHSYSLSWRKRAAIIQLRVQGLRYASLVLTLGLFFIYWVIYLCRAAVRGSLI